MRRFVKAAAIGLVACGVLYALVRYDPEPVVKLEWKAIIDEV